ncbi:NAD(P)H-binding protein [Hydrogenothermus marinus]|uniref:NADH dehydrogenase n=1 Tax=Hydrogenothermus marinus TaxID=133270 RepID=A0A3M0C2S3_9AQUI|nr:NAD(P)H-binding protein [Hydrogenothermus marinus]RMA97252.1 NADH dehydrogenase [Hydrogenothermus marinus]
MKILITGSTGFVGRYIANKLSEKYKLILPVRNFEKAKNVLNINENIELLKFSEELNKIVEDTKPDIVINLLGILKEDRKNNITFEKVHYIFTEKLIIGSKKVGVKHFIQMSALGADIKSKSRYQKTKAMAEQVIKSSGLNYSIFRPSIILGKEQLLFKQFKQVARYLPFFVAPKGKLQPVNVLDVRDCFIKVVEDFKQNNIYELCGPKIITYKELFQFALNYLNIKKPVLELNRYFLLPTAILGSIFDFLPINYDQWLMLKNDNICSGKYEGVKSLLKDIRDPFNI